MERHHHGEAYPRSVTEAAMRIIQDHPDYSNQRIADMVGVLSEGTIRNWRELEMTEEAVEARRLRRGEHGRVLSEEEEQVFAGRIIWAHLLHQDTSTPSLVEFLAFLFLIENPDLSWLSRLLEKLHIAYLKAVPTHKCEVDESFRPQLIDYISKLRLLSKLGPSHFLNIDPTSVYSDARYVLQAVPSGR
jgi:hypothetical protein